MGCEVRASLSKCLVGHGHFGGMSRARVGLDLCLLEKVRGDIQSTGRQSIVDVTLGS